MASIKKASYYVHYLGWKKSSGLYGVQFTKPVVQELLQNSYKEGVQLHKLNIVITQKEIKISQEETANPRCVAIKYPTIPTSDVVFANVGSRSEDQDIVAVIFVGKNPANQFFANVHVYRCDSPQTANQLNRQLNQLIAIPENKKRLEMIEKELVSKGFMQTSGLFLNTSSSTQISAAFSDPPRDFVATSVNSITDELNQRFKRKDATLLLPPRDYDTISRNQGSTDLKQRLIAMQEDSPQNDASKPSTIFRKQMPIYNAPEPDYDEGERVLRDQLKNDISTQRLQYASANDDEISRRHTYTETGFPHDDFLGASYNSSRSSGDYGNRMQSSEKKIQLPSPSQMNKSGLHKSSTGAIIY